MRMVTFSSRELDIDRYKSFSDAEHMIERELYIGNEVSTVIYGIHLTLCVLSIHYLRVRRRTQRHATLYIAFSLLGVLSNGFAVVINQLTGQRMWIDERDSLGGSMGSAWSHQHDWYNRLACLTQSVTVLLNEMLFLYRCYVVFNKSFLILALPTLLFIASLTLALILNIKDIAFPANYYALAVAWDSVSVAFNIFITIAIISRIIHAHVQLRSALTSSLATAFTAEERNRSGACGGSGIQFTKTDKDDTYFGLVAILVESALPSTLAGVVAVALYIAACPGYVASLLIWSFTAGISQQLIILRVSMGKAWSEDTIVKLGGHDREVILAPKSGRQRQTQIGRRQVEEQAIPIQFFQDGSFDTNIWSDWRWDNRNGQPSPRLPFLPYSHDNRERNGEVAVPDRRASV